LHLGGVSVAGRYADAPARTILNNRCRHQCPNCSDGSSFGTHGCGKRAGLTSSATIDRSETTYSFVLLSRGQATRLLGLWNLFRSGSLPRGGALSFPPRPFLGQTDFSATHMIGTLSMGVDCFAYAYFWHADYRTAVMYKSFIYNMLIKYNKITFRIISTLHPESNV